MVIVRLLPSLEYLVRRSFGIDQNLFAEPVGVRAVPGRISPITAVGLMLNGLAIVLLERRCFQASQAVVSVVATASLFSLVSHLCGIWHLDSLGFVEIYTVMAMNTAFGLQLGVGTLMAFPESGFMAVTVSP